jgi:myo-inositol 2-dehydrogenase / D-chiro-inositol 1-dehydrogenase
MHNTGRRQFLASGAGLLLVPPHTAFGSQANSAIEVGIVGAGGRGHFIGGFFKEYGAHVVAAADPFEDALSKIQTEFKLDGSRLYKGLNGHRELAASKLDAVAVMSPPYFHPDHVASAVDNGKHVYLAKPAAADTAGCLSIARSGEKAKGKLTFVVDFQTRAVPEFLEAAKRLDRGDIGDFVMGQVYYHTGLAKMHDVSGLSPQQARLRNWLGDKYISGDIIVEQHIHAIDIGARFLRSNPVKAWGVGGRKARTDAGNCWDHFLVTYSYPGDVHVEFSSAQFVKGIRDICAKIYGTKGAVDAHYDGLVRITGENAWKGGDKVPTFTAGAQKNVRDFMECVRTGNHRNDAQIGANSTLTAILGRTAAYRGTSVTWDEMIKGAEKYEVKL